MLFFNLLLTRKYKKITTLILHCFFVLKNFSNFTETYKNLKNMKWYHYIACFFAGMFLANVVPHFIHGVSGDAFPTPFSNPPGKGLSSPTVNVYWGLFNLLVGYILFRVGKVSNQRVWSLVVFFIGVIVISVMLSYGFQDKMAH